ncbi:hypothetical protein WBJ53_15040 [Spirosoma sp. SC4-14]|uniref:hypothetical protein n=1 Tax=Spirosoma sp. SC4-14 TaxID=3128900 RepID=UPI0030D2B7D6
MASKFIEGHIKFQESILDDVRHLINEKGETSDQVQKTIDDALEELSGWYEMRDMFE